MSGDFIERWLLVLPEHISQLHCVFRVVRGVFIYIF